MTPGDDRDSRRIDGLLTSYGELMRELTAVDERQKAADAVQREAIREFRGMFEQIGRECNRRSDRVEEKVDDQADKLDALSSGIDAVRKRQWSPGEKAIVIAPTVSSLLAALALVITKGG